MRSAWLKNFGPDRYDVYCERWFGAMPERAHPAVTEQVLVAMRAVSRDVVAATAEGIWRLDPKPALRAYPGLMRALQTPTHDGPGSLHRVVPGLGWQAMMGTSHWIMMDDPAAFNALLDAFLGQPGIGGVERR